MKPTPPQVPGLPLIGNMRDFMGDRSVFFQRSFEKYGPIFSLQIGPKKMAVIAGAEAAETFFTKTDGDLRMDKAYGPLRAMFGEIAFTASPEVYNAQRHILHAPFKGGKMPGYVRVMQVEIQQWLDSLGTSGEIDLVESLAPVVQNVAAHAIMGEDFRKRMGREFWDLYEDLNKGLDMVFPPNWPLPKFRKRDRAKARMHEIIAPIIAERRTNSNQYDDMLQDFVEARYKDDSPVPDEIIIGLITALMFAGHETTVGQAAWTIVELLKHPDYLAKVQAEIDEKTFSGKPIDIGTMAQMQYVAWAVDETTRLHPSADMIMRAAETDIEVGDYRIPKGWMVLLGTEIGHRLPDTFEEAEAYDPLRYAPGREEQKQHKYTITGFGGGAHKCTGMNFANNEMLLITTMLLQQFELELLNPNPTRSYSVGANRPAGAVVRYKRKAQQAIPAEVMAQAVAAGCPHITAMQDAAQTN